MDFFESANASSNVSSNETIWDTEPQAFFQSSPLAVFKMTYYYVASAASVIGNALLITTVCKRPTLQKNSYYLVSNLACKDLLFAFVTAVLFVPGLYWGQWIFGHATCIIFGFLSTWFAYTELLLLVAISVDRYFACIYPLRYHQLVTVKRITIGLIFCWTYSLFWVLVPFTGFGGYHYRTNLLICQLNWTQDILPRIYINVVGAFIFFPGTAIIIFCYIQIYRGAKKIAEPPVFVAQPQLNDTARERTQPRTPSRSNKATLTVGLITGIYFLCWIPYVGIRLSQHYVHSFDDIPALLLIEEITVYTFTISNYGNPIIYGIYNREFRAEFKKLFKGRG